MPPENFESPSQSLTPAQFAAIKKSRELSEIVLDLHPEIAQDYRDGFSLREIVIKYNLIRSHQVSFHIASRAVRFVIKMLISDMRERANLERDHRTTNNLKMMEQQRGIFGLHADQRVFNSRMGGILTAINGKGVFSLTKKELRENGKRTYENRIGIHAMHPKEREIASQKGGVNAVYNKKGIHALSKEKRIEIANIGKLLSGKSVPWDMIIDSETGLTEGEYCDMLALVPNNQYCRAGKTQAKSSEIANQLNQKFHGGNPVRSESSVCHRLRKLKATRVA